MQTYKTAPFNPVHGPPPVPEEIMKESILLAACGEKEVLPQNPELPADVFTACLTTPIKVRPPPC
jgi:regulator-associated protein of mTOR